MPAITPEGSSDGGSALAVRSHIRSGLSLGTLNTSNNTIPLNSGEVVIVTDTGVEKFTVDAQTIDLGAPTVNEIFVDTTEELQEVSITVTASGYPNDRALKIAEVDTNNDTVDEQWNYIADDFTLTYPNEAAIDSEDADGKLRVGTTVYDRNSDTEFVITG